MNDNAAQRWDDITVAIQKDRDSDGFVIVALDQNGKLMGERLVSKEAGRFIWSSLVNMAYGNH